MTRWVAMAVCLAGWSVGLPASAAEPAAVLEKVETLEEQAASETVPADAAEPLTEAEAAVVDPEGDAPLEDPLTCLARTVYWEAKGEDLAAMEAVANVVMNRLTDDVISRTRSVPW
jgi:spore germination cell wall hydrolase CwlJ-like protein